MRTGVSFGAALGVAVVVSVNAYGQAAQAPAGGRGAQPGLEPRIVLFEARPASVRAGDPVVLVWQTENPGGVSLAPDVGTVTARGSKTVTPSATTIYTLSMRNGPSKTVTVTVQPANAAAGRPDNARSAGLPDLTGVYGNAGLPPGTTAPPLKPGAEKFQIVRGANDIRGRTTLTTGNDCKPLGIPQTYITPYPFQIIQLPKQVVIIYEYPNAIRWIPTDGRAHEVDPDPTWMGSSVGHWEGDTLVVDAVGFNDKTEVHGFMHTDALHVIERFRRQPDGNLQYEVTVEDPNVWQNPWKIAPRTFPLRRELENVSEFVCESTVDYQRLFKQ
jgi:hypothetical protein